MDEEAEVSDDEKVSSDEEGSVLDHSLDGFINDATQMSQGYLFCVVVVFLFCSLYLTVCYKSVSVLGLSCVALFLQMSQCCQPVVLSFV